MKKLDTLKKTLANTEAEKMLEAVKQIANNEAVQMMKELDTRSIMSILEYAELQKALNNSKYQLLLDINYEKFKSDSINLFIYSLITTNNKRALHIYQKNNNTFDISFSSDKNTIEKLQYFNALTSDYTLKHKYKKDKSIKDSYLTSVDFDKMIDACKFALLILESSIEDLQSMTETNAE